MFGSNDPQTQSNDDPAMLDNVKQLASQPASQVVPPQPQADEPPAAPPADTAPASDTAAAPSAPPVEHPAQPAAGFSSGPTPQSAPSTPPEPAATTPPADTPEPPTPDPQPTDMTPPADTPAPSSPFSVSAPADPTSADTSGDTPIEDDSTPPSDPEHLSGLKQEALEHLEPLTDHIDGTPEETFKTTMMMIQANDNHTLLEKALTAAKQIEDDKVRAQALLDIINEINYFASQQSN